MNQSISYFLSSSIATKTTRHTDDESQSSSLPLFCYNTTCNSTILARSLFFLMYYILEVFTKIETGFSQEKERKKKRHADDHDYADSKFLLHCPVDDLDIDIDVGDSTHEQSCVRTRLIQFVSSCDAYNEYYSNYKYYYFRGCR